MTEAIPPKLMIPQLIVGLGNPGTRYEKTRHNVGFMAIDTLAHTWQIGLSQNKKFQGMFGEGNSPRGKIRLLKPTTYMNNSGQAIRAVVDWYKLSPEAVLVVYDDMDLPVGRLRIRLAGSAGGQKGMKSTIDHLGTQAFPRLRIGIGSAKSAAGDHDAVSHVLGKFSGTDAKLIDQVLRLTVDAIDLSLKQGVEKAMSLYNNRIVEQQNA